MDIRRNNIDLIKYHTIAFDKQEMWQKIRAKKKRKNRLFILFFFFIGLSAFGLLNIYNKNIESNDCVENTNLDHQNENHGIQNIISSNVNVQKVIGLEKIKYQKNIKSTTKINSSNLLNSEITSSPTQKFIHSEEVKKEDNNLIQEYVKEIRDIGFEILPIKNQQVKKENTKLIILENLVNKKPNKRKNEVQLNFFSGLSFYSYSNENNESKYKENLKKYVKPLEEISVRLNYRHFLNDKNQIEIGLGLIKSTNKLTFLEESKMPVESLKAFEYSLVRVSNYKTYQSQYLLNIYGGYNREVKILNTRTDISTGVSFVVYDNRKGYTINENLKVIDNKDYYSERNNLSFHFASKIKIIDRNKLNLSLGPEIRIGLSNSNSKTNILETRTKALGLGLQLGF